MVVLPEPRTVVVTGADGFLGRRVARRLMSEPATDTVLLSRRTSGADQPGATRVVSTLEELSEGTWSEAGVTKVDVLVHLGAYTPKARDAFDSVDEVYRDNLQGTRGLLESMPTPVSQVVFGSTLDVYGRAKGGGPLSEQSGLDPVGLYAASKVFCEELVRVYGREWGGSCCILRYGNLFGPGEEAYRKLIPETIRKLLRGERPVVHSGGVATRDYLYVDDAAEATARAAHKAPPDGTVINVVSGVSRTVREVVELLVDLTGFQGGIDLQPGGAPQYALSFDNRRMHQLMDSWTMVPFAEGLRREIAHVQSLGE